MESVTIAVRNRHVVFVNHVNGVSVALEWRAADDIGRTIAHTARGMHNVPLTVGPLAIHPYADGLFVELNSKALFAAPAEVAARIGYALVAKAREIEEMDAFEDLVFDQAILQRAGAPFGLTNNRRIQAEAGKEAAWNTELRKYISSVRLRQRQVGTPGVKHGD